MGKNKEIELFEKISVYLTGFSEVELWGTTMLEAYYDFLVANYDPSDLQYFFAEVDAIFDECGTDKKAIKAAVKSRIFPLSAYNGLAQKLITLWYTGNWGAGNDSAPISAQAYVQGLIWNAGMTHPPGAKQPGYGSWSVPPVNIKN